MSVVIIIHHKGLAKPQVWIYGTTASMLFHIRTVPYTARLIIPIRPEYKKLDAR